MTRLKSIVAFVLLTILCHLLALAASRDGYTTRLMEQSERNKRWDEWKNLGKVGALVGEKVIDLLIKPPLSTFLIEALYNSADRLLEVESEEYRAIEELTHIVERQHETSLRRFNEMQRPVKDLISDKDYSHDVELYLWSLLNAYNEYSDSIGKSKELQNIKMDRLGEECEFYKPIASLRKILNTVEHCFLSNDSDHSHDAKMQQTQFFNFEILFVNGNVIASPDFANYIPGNKYMCKLERAYHVKENQSASLSSTVNAIMSNVEQLIVFSRICSAVVHKDNALEREDVFNTTAKIGAEINSKMVEWAENRFEGAWPDEMRSKAIEIIESFTQDDEIPQYDLQKLSDRIRTAMQSMASRK